jgi:hypothetical protein
MPKGRAPLHVYLLDLHGLFWRVEKAARPGVVTRWDFSYFLETEVPYLRPFDVNGFKAKI